MALTNDVTVSWGSGFRYKRPIAGQRDARSQSLSASKLAWRIDDFMPVFETEPGIRVL